MNENPDLVATDATLKINWQGYSCILMGTTDLSKIFIDLVSCLVTKKALKILAFKAFKTLTTLSQKIESDDYFPSHLLVDNCDAIIQEEIWVINCTTDELFVRLATTDIHTDKKISLNFEI